MKVSFLIFLCIDSNSIRIVALYLYGEKGGGDKNGKGSEVDRQKIKYGSEV